MKKITLAASALLIAASLSAPVFAQDESPAQAQESAAAPAAAPAKPAVRVRKKVRRKKNVKKAQTQQPAAPVAVKPVSVEPEPVVAPAAVPQAPKVETATAAPAAVSAPVIAEAPRRSACPNCFQPLLAGYNDIISELKPWMDEMDVQASDFERRLSAIQKHIDEKDDAIEKAKLGTDKHEVKAAVKDLSRERKTFLKDYSEVRDEKEDFYKQFSKEIEKKIEGYNKTVKLKLKITQAAALQ